MGQARPASPRVNGCRPHEPRASSYRQPAASTKGPHRPITAAHRQTSHVPASPTRTCSCFSGTLSSRCLHSFLTMMQPVRHAERARRCNCAEQRRPYPVIGGACIETAKNVTMQEESSHLHMQVPASRLRAAAPSPTASLSTGAKAGAWGRPSPLTRLDRRSRRVHRQILLATRQPCKWSGGHQVAMLTHSPWGCRTFTCQNRITRQV